MRMKFECERCKTKLSANSKRDHGGLILCPTCTMNLGEWVRAGAPDSAPNGEYADDEAFVAAVANRAAGIT